MLTGCGDSEPASTGAETTAPDSAKVASVCPVSGEKIGSMGEGVVVEHDGKKVKLCCQACVSKFEADPEKYLKAAADTSADDGHDHSSHDHGTGG